MGHGRLIPPFRAPGSSPAPDALRQSRRIPGPARSLDSNTDGAGSTPEQQEQPS